MERRFLRGLLYAITVLAVLAIVAGALNEKDLRPAWATLIICLGFLACSTADGLEPAPEPRAEQPEHQSSD